MFCNFRSMKGTSLIRLSAFAILTFFGLRSLEAQVIIAPWSEAFTGVSIGVPNYNSGSTIPSGWARTPSTTGGNQPTSAYWWGGGQGQTHTRAGGGLTGPSADHTSGTGGHRRGNR